MATQTWMAGKTGDWFTAPIGLQAACLQSAIPPSRLGNADHRSERFAIEGVTIILGGSPFASLVTLAAIDAVFAGPAVSRRRIQNSS